VGRLGLAPGIFNINEPVLFGMPIVLNAIFFIPFAIAPLVAVIIAYVATMLHWVDPVVSAVPWVTPPIMNAFLATGFDWRAIILAIVNLLVTFAIWTPFVIAANKMEEPEL
jgi:Phosphotransferase system cellobiose-specific component IIC